jgi:hypothetical protein
VPSTLESRRVGNSNIRQSRSVHYATLVPTCLKHGEAAGEFHQKLSAVELGLGVSVNRAAKSKRLGTSYRAGRSAHWLKIKYPAAPAVRRLEEEDWTYTVPQDAVR